MRLSADAKITATLNLLFAQTREARVEYCMYIVMSLNCRQNIASCSRAHQELTLTECRQCADEHLNGIVKTTYTPFRKHLKPTQIKARAASHVTTLASRQSCSHFVARRLSHRPRTRIFPDQHNLKTAPASNHTAKQVAQPFLQQKRGSYYIQSIQ